jgi:hypothetical protein
MSLIEIVKTTKGIRARIDETDKVACLVPRVTAKRGGKQCERRNVLYGVAPDRTLVDSLVKRELEQRLNVKDGGPSDHHYHDPTWKPPTEIKSGRGRKVVPIRRR